MGRHLDWHLSFVGREGDGNAAWVKQQGSTFACELISWPGYQRQQSRSQFGCQAGVTHDGAFNMTGTLWSEGVHAMGK